MLLTKTTDAQNEDTLSYHRVRALYFLAGVFVATIVISYCIFRYYCREKKINKLIPTIER